MFNLLNYFIPKTAVSVKLAGIFLFCILTLSSRAQTYFYNDQYFDNPVTFEAGVSVGPMNSLTDIGGRSGKGRHGPKDLNIKSTKIFGSIYAAAVYKHFLALRLEGTVGSIKSNDSLLAPVKKSDAIGRYNRNLSFKSPIYELSLTAEFHPITFFQSFDPERYPPAFSPYMIGGVGVFHFNPQANLNGEWIALQPLHTEGEGFAEYPDRPQYKLNQINVPLGIGVLYEASTRLNFRLEYITRQLFTDYIDDVHSKYIEPALFSQYLTGTQLSQALALNNRGRSDAVPNLTTARPGGRRGNPLNNDSYFSINFKVGYVFGRESIFGDRQSLKRQRKCPDLF